MKAVSRLILPAMFLGLFIFSIGCSDPVSAPIDRILPYLGEYDCNCTETIHYTNPIGIVILPDTQEMITVIKGTEANTVLVYGMEFFIGKDASGLYSEPGLTYHLYFYPDSICMTEWCLGCLGHYTYKVCTGLKS